MNVARTQCLPLSDSDESDDDEVSDALGQPDSARNGSCECCCWKPSAACRCPFRSTLIITWPVFDPVPLRAEWDQSL